MSTRPSSVLTNVIPAKAGIQKHLKSLDPDFRRDDEKDLCQQPAKGEWLRVGWEDALKQLSGILAKVAPADRAVVLSAQSSNEENFTWWWLAKEQWKTSHCFGTWRQPPDPSEDHILRHADKNPNTRCLQELKVHRPYDGSGKLVIVLDTLTPQEIAALQKARPAFVVVLATNWGSDPSAARWRPFHSARDVGRGTWDEKSSYVQATRHDVLAGSGRPTSYGSVLTWADLVLPLAVFAEQEGTFVNVQGRVQRFERAFPPKGEAETAWQIAGRVAGLEQLAWPWSGPEDVFRSMGELVPSFRGLSYAVLGEQGALLR